MNKLFTFLLIIFIVSCKDASEKLIGKWKLVETVQNGFNLSDEINENYVIEFSNNGKYLYYVNGKDRGNRTASYVINNDSISLIFADTAFHHRKAITTVYFRLTDNKLTIIYSKYDSSTYKRIKSDEEMTSYIYSSENRRHLIRKGILQYDARSYYWKASSSKDSLFQIELSLSNRGDISYTFIKHEGSNDCSYYFDAILTSDSTINLLWGFNIDSGCSGEDLNKLLYIHQPNEISKFPKKGDVFATYTLINNSTLNVKYKFPEWTNKVNRLSKGTIFPDHFQLKLRE